jgi:hypothetical protein
MEAKTSLATGRRQPFDQSVGSRTIVAEEIPCISPKEWRMTEWMKAMIRG